MRITIVTLAVLFLLALLVIRVLLSKIELMEREITELKQRLCGHKTPPEMSEEVRQERLERAQAAGCFYGDVDE